VTAEFAIVLPAVVALLALGVGVAQVGAVPVRLADAAADAARMIGRGDAAGDAAARVAAAQDGAVMEVSRSGSLVCVTVRASASSGGLGSLFAFEGRGCALDDEGPAE
jgi:Flp pilus assembly protein TadG